MADPSDPAYPTSTATVTVNEGVTTRQFVATYALTAIIAAGGGNFSPAVAAKNALLFADELLAQEAATA